MYINKFLDDEIYRQQIIKIIPFTDNIIKYFDEKFYTGKYKHNYFTIDCIDFFPFS